jgi:hypothetical protein
LIRWGGCGSTDGFVRQQDALGYRLASCKQHACQQRTEASTICNQRHVLSHAAAAAALALHNVVHSVPQSYRMLQPAVCYHQQILAPAVVVLALPMYIAAGLQHRWQAYMLPPTPAWHFAAAAVLHALCTLLGCWALCTNKFFSSVVRVTAAFR